MMILSYLEVLRIKGVKPTKSFNQNAALILSTCLLGILWFLPASSKLVCLERECNAISILDIAENRDLVQTFDLRFQVKSNASRDYVSDYRDINKAVGLSWNKEQQLLITVPMRHGSTTFFGYTTPRGVVLRDLRISVVNSKSISIFVDNKIAYSHRYENAPFYINPKTPIATSNQAGKVDFKETDFNIKIEKKSNSILRVASVLFVIIYFGFVTLMLLRRFLPGAKKNNVGRKDLDFNLFGLVVISWVLSIVVWFRNPIDSTGAVNPGPLGPIGAAFSDFFQLSQLAQYERPYDLGGTNYPPAGLLFLRIVSSSDPNELSFFPIAGIVLGTLFFLFDGSFRKKRELMIFLGSFPLIFGIVRGNLDLLAIFFVWISVLEWKREKFVTAGFFLAFAISLKVWPVIFLALYFKKRSYKSVITALTVGLNLTLVSSFFLGYFNLIEIIRISSIAIFDQSKLGTYAFQNTFSATALLFIGHVLLFAKNPLNISQTDVDISLAFVNGSYAVIITCALLAAFAYFFLKAESLSIEFLILCGIAVCIPTQSFTYRGLVILLFFHLRIQEFQKLKKSKFHGSGRMKKNQIKQTNFPNKFVSFSAVPLFAPVTFYFVPGTQFSTASLLQPLGLITFIGLMIFQEKGERERSKAAQVTL
jgi:hypothetical protein